MRALCDRHLGVGADGVLALAPADEPGYVARLRIYNPDGSEAELSGNGARQAILYLREHGWTTVATPTRSRPSPARSAPRSPASAPAASTWAARSCASTGELARPCASSTSRSATRRRRSASPSVEELEALDLATLGPPIEHHEAFPNRTNVSFWTELAPDRIRARIFERGVGETLSSGTGASGAAVAHVLRGGDSPVTVVLDGGELEVDVDEALHVDLTGWAVPVFRGELS